MYLVRKNRFCRVGTKYISYGIVKPQPNGKKVKVVTRRVKRSGSVPDAIAHARKLGYRKSHTKNKGVLKRKREPLDVSFREPPRQRFRTAPYDAPPLVLELTSRCGQVKRFVKGERMMGSPKATKHNFHDLCKIPKFYRERTIQRLTEKDLEHLRIVGLNMFEIPTKKKSLSRFVLFLDTLLKFKDSFFIIDHVLKRLVKENTPDRYRMFLVYYLTKTRFGKFVARKSNMETVTNLRKLGILIDHFQKYIPDAHDNYKRQFYDTFIDALRKKTPSSDSPISIRSRIIHHPFFTSLSEAKSEMW